MPAVDLKLISDKVHSGKEYQADYNQRSLLWA